MKTNQIIGEVECSRPFFKKLPATFIELMFDELMKSQTGTGGQKGSEDKRVRSQCSPLKLHILQVKVLLQELPIYLGSDIRLRRR